MFAVLSKENKVAQNNQKKQKQKQRKLRQRQVKDRKKNARLASVVIPEPSSKIARKLDEIYECFEDGELNYVIELLETLARSSPKSAAVAEVEAGIYQRMGNNEEACRAARRLLKIVPENAEAMLGYAQASLFCARSSIALIQYRKFLDRWPNHELVARAVEPIEICETESRRRVDVANQKGGLSLKFDDGGLEFYARHEASLERMSSNNLAEAIVLLEQNLKEQPQFMSSRNNLVICHFYQGDFELAVDAARETCQLFPDNRFAQANLVKVEFLSGNPEKANDLADKMIIDPPSEQDAYTAAVEALSFLGRDHDIVVLSQMLETVTPIDDDKKGVLLHHFAVANFRMDDRDEAVRLWNQCIEVYPDHSDALENVEDLEAGGGNAAWAEPMGKWLPQPFMQEIIKKYEQDIGNVVGLLAKQNPVVATLVPALLDRGDPVGREFALNFASFDATPPMLQALKDFALGNRGPDSMRNRAMMTLRKEQIIDAGPHRFYSRGKWTDIKLMTAEITREPVEVEAWKSELLEEGYWAMSDGDLAVAEEAFQQVLDRDPDCRSARFNLAGVWQRRGRGDEPDMAMREMRQIHSEHPDYSFAAMAVAMFEAENGNFELAKKILGEIYALPKLHISEAMMLFASQVQVSLAEDDLQAAEESLNMMQQIAEEDDPQVLQLRAMIEHYRFANVESPSLIN